MVIGKIGVSKDLGIPWHKIRVKDFEHWERRSSRRRREGSIRTPLSKRRAECPRCTWGLLWENSRWKGWKLVGSGALASKGRNTTFKHQLEQLHQNYPMACRGLLFTRGYLFYLPRIWCCITIWTDFRPKMEQINLQPFVTPDWLVLRHPRLRYTTLMEVFSITLVPLGGLFASFTLMRVFHLKIRSYL